MSEEDTPEIPLHEQPAEPFESPTYDPVDIDDHVPDELQDVAHPIGLQEPWSSPSSPWLPHPEWGGYVPQSPFWGPDLSTPWTRDWWWLVPNSWVLEQELWDVRLLGENRVADGWLFSLRRRLNIYETSGIKSDLQVRIAMKIRVLEDPKIQSILTFFWTGLGIAGRDPPIMTNFLICSDSFWDLSGKLSDAINPPNTALLSVLEDLRGALNERVGELGGR